MGITRRMCKAAMGIQQTQKATPICGVEMLFKQNNK
jgi:hypothetical protein